MELSFCKLKSKEVINVCDGTNLGNITDIVFDCSCGRILGIVIPSQKNFFSFFKSGNEIFIPYNRICKIGKDIILVDIIMQQNRACQSIQNNNTKINNENINKNNINIQSVINDINNTH